MKAVRDGLDGLVSDGMSESIIHALEMVDVDHQTTQLASLVATFSKRFLKQGIKRTAVQTPGQRVSRGQAFQLAVLSQDFRLCSFKIRHCPHQRTVHLGKLPIRVLKLHSPFVDQVAQFIESSNGLVRQIPFSTQRGGLLQDFNAVKWLLQDQ